MKQITGWICAALACCAGAAGLRAAEPTVAELDQRIKELERKLEAADENSAAAKTNAAMVRAGTNGFWLGSADKSFQMRIGGYLQADGSLHPGDAGQTAADSFTVHRVRPIAEGRVYGDFAFRVMLDLTGNQSATLQDGYVEYSTSPQCRLRVGKFKPPVGLEFLQSETDIAFAERGLPSQIVPGRDIGVQISGEISSGLVEYVAGIFNGVPDGGSPDADSNDAKDFAGRLFLHPFRLTDAVSLANFGIGIGASAGDEQGTPASPDLPAYKSSGQQTFFSYKTSTNANSTAYADGRNIRLSPQACYYIGPVGLLGEYAQSQREVGNGKEAATINSSAWQILGSWVLTGEDATFRGVTPRNNFNPRAGHFGALELVARYQELTVDDAAFSSGLADPKKSASVAKSWSAGLNWYLNRAVRVLLDYEQTAFEGGASTGDRPEEKIILGRLQLVL